MTCAKVASLGVPLEFAWETLIETAQTKNGGVQKALDCFYHPEEDCLVRHFDRLFGTEKFSFDMKNPQKHKEILEILNGVIMEDVDCQMDILGWVYEQHLKTGSSAARDLGQFFTDRFICEYMMELCAPGFKSAGVPESVCDPAMGTGGFLTAFVKFYNKHHADKPIDWAVQQKEIHGCDTDPKVAGVARLNLFMETGGNRSTNLHTHDSLYGDLTRTQYDLILANMPFGLKGIKHADCCERVKDLKIRGTKSEPLFLQLMMVSLNRGGRCAVVVPDGMLVNGSSCHDETRKYLLDHFELKRVIKMKGQFFMNTGIQPSILFFVNTGKPTSVVEFWDVIKGVNGDIEEKIVLSVPRGKFDASCSFDMRRYQEVKAVANPAGFPMVKLGDIAECKNGKNIPQEKRTENGSYPYYASNGISGYVEQFNFQGPATLIGDQGSCWMKSTHYTSENNKFYAGNHTIVMKAKTDTLNIKYLYYYLKLSNLMPYNRCSALIPELDKIRFYEMNIPLPPPSIQQEIVATLDRIYAPGTTELAETLKLTDKAMDLVLANPGGASLEPIVEAQRLMRKSAQMVADVKAQMVADVRAQMVAVIRASSIRSTSVIRSLNDVCSVSFGERITQKNNKGTLYPVYGGGEANFHTDRFNREGKTCKVARFAVSEKSMVLMINDKYWLMDSGFTVTSKVKDSVHDEFLWWILWANQKIISECSTGSCQKNIAMDMFYKLEFGFPSIEIQTQTLQRLNALQTQLTSLENLGKQAEDNARFILDSYLNTA
jgi:restriction endonuclease S subunit